MPATPTSASTHRSFTDGSPRPPSEGHHFQPAVSPLTSRLSQSSNIPIAGPRSSEHRGYATYRPRRSTSTWSLRERSRSASRPGSTPNAQSWSVNRSGDRGTLDNWQGLRELVTNEVDDEDDATLRGPLSPALSFGARREGSSGNIRSFFSPSSDRSSGIISIPRSRTGDECESSAISAAIFSSSPPQMDRPDVERMMDEAHITSGIIEEEREETDGEANGVHSLLLTTKSVARPDPDTSKPSSKPRRVYWPPSPVFIAILKCVITYLIASLFTFVPALARLLSTSSEIDAHGRVTPRPAYSAHMVATIVVYFNPAKTIGNMFLSTRFCIVLAALAATVSFLAMGTLHFFDHFSPSQGSNWDWISELGDWVVCVLWIGGSMALLAWSKVWVNNPSFNSGCSMAAVTIYTVVIKEGAIPKLLEVLLIVSIGALITNVTCYLVFPMSATTRLQASIARSLKSFSTLLDLLTSTFLLEKSVVRDSHISLKDAVKSHASAFRTLQNDLAEAKNERIFDARIRGKKLDLYDAAIGSLARLAQHLASLRGSTRLQESLIRASREGKINLDLEDPNGLRSNLSISVLDDHLPPGPDLDEDVDIQSSIKLFLTFRDIAGHEMDQLVAKCDDALDVVQAASTGEYHDSESMAQIRQNLAASIRVFTRCSSKAIKRLYAGPKREQGIYGDTGHDLDSDDELHNAEHFKVDIDSLSDGPNETVFLIYFFLFTLEEFARELLYLLDTYAQILDAEPVPALVYLRSLWSKTRKNGRQANYLYKQFRAVVPVDPSELQPPLFPKNARDGRNTLVSEQGAGSSVWETAKKRSWEIGDWLRQPNIRYAMKTGIGGAILAAPAYTEAGRPLFLEYRGEWALIAYFSAISPTVGQTNFLSFFRVTGTILGASVAVLFYTLWLIFPENPIILPILGVIFSIPCFYVITQMPDFAQAGRFTLLTYNLTCLYAYNSRERDVSALSIAFHRSTSVIIGVVWAAIVSRYWWPFTARRELRMGLSDFCLDLSYLYSKLVTTYSMGVDTDVVETEQSTDETEPLLPVGALRSPHLNRDVRQFMAMELHLQQQLGSLRILLAQTKNEPRLKGPFAFDFYNEVLLGCERMLDRLHSMRCVTTRDEWDNGIREAFVKPVNRQRREMAGNVILYFYTLSAGFRLRTPMPPYLPPAEQARERLVEAIRSLDVVKRRSVRGGGRHLLFFAYALAMQEVIAELEYLGELMQDAFGVISQSTVIDFERLFESSAQV